METYVPAVSDGVVQEVVVEQGDVVEAGALIARVG